MLSWTQRSDGWYSNGFRIELAGPFRWLLLEGEPDTSSVSLGPRPLAVARSLTECKREAELVVSARARAEVQRRHFAILLLTVAATILLVGSVSSNTAVVVGIVGICLATRSVLTLLGTLLPTFLGQQHEVFYQ